MRNERGRIVAGRMYEDGPIYPRQRVPEGAEPELIRSIYDAVTPIWPKRATWTPMWDTCGSPGKACYTLPSGNMVHVKPGCRCLPQDYAAGSSNSDIWEPGTGIASGIGLLRRPIFRPGSCWKAYRPACVKPTCDQPARR